MVRTTSWSLLSIGLWLLTTGAVSKDSPRPWPGEELAGGETTVFDSGHAAFGRALHNLDPSRWLAMRAGKRLFENPWYPAGTAAAPRRGLGPLFNATACTDCHFRDGRGGPPDSPAPGAALQPPPFLLRLAGPAGAGDPIYGHQLNDRAVGGPAEGRLRVEYEEVTGSFADGRSYRLRRPRASVTGLAYGPLGGETGVSLRIPPALIGLGLLEAVPELALEALADPEDLDGDGISGRVQRLGSNETVGRFGWKAGQPDLEAQVARAFHQDLGVTSSHYPEQNCAPHQEGCRRPSAAPAGPFGGDPIATELSDAELRRVALYTRLLAPPARRDWQDLTVLQGREVFASLACGSCHRAELRTGDGGPGTPPELAGQTIRPFTDLLLHDMGPELADGVAEHSASPSEWRTAPLWGLGLIERVNGHLRLLHDGRARSVEEAILWHGGEAERSRRAYLRLPADRRAALLRFVSSL